MGEVIEFPKKIKVELEDDIPVQTRIELAIIFLWNHFGGNELRSSLTTDEYNLSLLQFSDYCFQAMEDKQIIVTEDNQLGMSLEITKMMIGAVDDFAKRKFSDDDN